MSTSPRKYRGSRKHILDWTSQPAFVVQLLQLIEPVSCKITAASEWMPKGYLALEEARLERFGPKTLPGHPAWDLIRGWWLKHSRGANTPNWDLAVRAEIDEKPGLILVEAKANVPGLSASGKFLPKEGSTSNSFENHDHIGRAIDDANSEMQACVPGICIGRDKHYQLSNRLAFAWKLASLGIPTVLVYLGFVGDTGIADVGDPFIDDGHWQRIFREKLLDVCPNPQRLLERAIGTSKESMWVLCRSRPVLELSSLR